MVNAVGDWFVIALPRLHGWRSKKTLLIASIVLLVLTAGCYVLWSRYVWAQYTPAYTQWHQAIKSDIKKTIELPVANEKDQNTLMGRLENISQRIVAEEPSVCEAPVAVSWQQRFVTEYREAQADCQMVVSNVVAFQKKLDAVTAYISDDHDLAKISAAALPPGEAGDLAWGEQVKIWGQVVDDVKGLAVSEAFKPTRQVAVEKSTAVKIAWESLIAAHQSKDKIGYATAQGALGASYDGLNAISLDSTRDIAKLTAALNDAYIKAFAE